MAGLLRIFNVAEKMSLVDGPNSANAYRIPDLTAGDLLPVEFTLLQNSLSGGWGAPWSKVLVGSYALKIGLFLAGDRSQLSFQDTWTADAGANLYAGTLSLNTSQISTALTSVTTVSCIFEAQIVLNTGAVLTPFRQTLNLLKPYITAAAIVPPAGEVGATQAWSLGTLVPRVAPLHAPQIIRSPDGSQFSFYVDDNGKLCADRIG